MPRRLSRRSIAAYAAERLIQGDVSVVDELAALLVTERREREVDLLVRDIEEQLERRGLVVVKVETARTLDMVLRRQIEAMFPGKTVQLHEVVRPDIIGGCRITTPRQMLDGTLAGKLTALKAMKL